MMDVECSMRVDQHCANQLRDLHNPCSMRPGEFQGLEDDVEEPHNVNDCIFLPLHCSHDRRLCWSIIIQFRWLQKLYLTWM